MLERLKKYLAYQRKKRLAREADRVAGLFNSHWCGIPPSAIILGTEEAAMQKCRDSLDQLRRYLDEVVKAHPEWSADTPDAEDCWQETLEEQMEGEQVQSEQIQSEQMQRERMQNEQMENEQMENEQMQSEQNR